MARSLALFVPTLGGGGAERVMVVLANAFAQRGLRVDLLAGIADGAFKPLVSPRVSVVDLNADSVAKCVPGLVRYLRKAAPASVLSGMTHANIMVTVAHRLAHSNARLVLTEHSTLSQEERHGKGRLLPALARLIYRRANKIVAVSEGAASDLEDVLRLARGRVQVIYNPVEDSQEDIDDRLAHPWLTDREAPVVITVGRLTPAKDHEVLLKAFAILRSKHRVRLVILGEGGERRRLEKLVEELDLTADVVMPGFVDCPAAWVRHASLFVLSSRWEGFANALVEAMWCGTQVVATDCRSGPGEILESGKWGRLVPVGSEQALAEAMAEALADLDPPDVRRRASDFGVDRAVDAYLEALLGS